MMDFAVVIPAYNEASNVAPLFTALREAFEHFDLRGDIIFVDDGSTDDTYERALAAIHEYPFDVRIVRHDTNIGKTEAIYTAAQMTSKSIVVLFDADLQHSPHEIPRFLQEIDQGWDMVVGRKVGSYEKQLSSDIYNFVLAKLFGAPVNDLNAMKAFRREILDLVPMRHDWHRFFAVIAHAAGCSMTEIDIALYPRRFETSKYTGLGRVFGTAFQLIPVWRSVRNAQRNARQHPQQQAEHQWTMPSTARPTAARPSAQ